MDRPAVISEAETSIENTVSVTVTQAEATLTPRVLPVTPQPSPKTRNFTKMNMAKANKRQELNLETLCDHLSTIKQLEAVDLVASPQPTK